MKICQMNKQDMISIFFDSPDNAFFDQKVLSSVFGLSEKWFELRRCRGDGIVFYKFGRSVRYRKIDVLNWIEKQSKTKTKYKGKTC